MSKSYQDGWDEKYCYPRSDVLKNKLNIQNQEKLHNTERYATKMRSSQLMESPIKGNLDFKHLQNIHYILFQDLYNWAGKIRTVNIAKGELFCLPEWIPDMAEDIFKKLEKDKYLIQIPQDKISEKLAYYTSEINALHPFREGNGRSQREFIRELGMMAGYEINYQTISGEEMIKASIDGFNQNYKTFEGIYKRITRPFTLEEHLKKSSQVIVNGSKTEKELKEYFSRAEDIKNNLKKAHFKADSKIVKCMMQLNKSIGKNHSLLEIKQLYKQKENLEPNQKELVIEIVEDFKKQEKARNKFRGLER